MEEKSVVHCCRLGECSALPQKKQRNNERKQKENGLGVEQATHATTRLQPWHTVTLEVK